jgi:hypothetical protein
VKDLDAEGLGEYREYLLKLFQNHSASSSSSASAASSLRASHTPVQQQQQQQQGSRATTLISEATSHHSSTTISTSHSNTSHNLIELIFRSIDRQNTGRISVGDAEKILLRLNSRLGRRYGEDDVVALFDSLDENHDQTIDLEEFRKAFHNLNLA